MVHDVRHTVGVSMKGAVSAHNMHTIEPAKDTSTADEGASPETLENQGGNPERDTSDTFEKRYKDLQSFASKKELDWQRKEQELLKQLSELQKNQPKKQDFTPPLAEEELEAWIEQFPDLGKVIMALSHKQAREIVASREEELNSRLSTFEQERKERETDRLRQAVLKKHPDAEALEHDPEFVNWYSTQRPSIKNLIATGDPEDLIDLIDRFKSATGRTDEAKREKKKEVAVNPVAFTAPTPKSTEKVYLDSEVKKMPLRMYEKEKPEIDKAIREGRYNFNA